MFEYFRGWRRKVGVLTLVMACVFLCGWVRGYSYLDSVAFGSDAVSTSQYGIMWMRVKSLENPPKPARLRTGWDTTPLSEIGEMNPIDASFRPERFNWRWTRYGFDFVEVNQNKPAAVMTICVVPYWFLVIPLTLSSGWSLFSKPRLPTVSNPSHWRPKAAACGTQRG